MNPNETASDKPGVIQLLWTHTQVYSPLTELLESVVTFRFQVFRYWRALAENAFKQWSKGANA